MPHEGLASPIYLAYEPLEKKLSSAHSLHLNCEVISNYDHGLNVTLIMCMQVEGS